MLWPILVILLILWLLGFVSGYTVDYFIHNPAVFCHHRHADPNRR